MSRKKQEKAQRRLGDINELLKQQDDWLREIDENFSAIKGITDLAQKILELHALQASISKFSYATRDSIEEMAKRHIRDDRKIYKSRPVDSEKKYERTWEIKKEYPVITVFDLRLNERQTHVSETISETARNCKLEEVSSSPHFSEAFKKCEPLRDRFTAAAAAKAALGDVSSQQTSQQLPADPKITQQRTDKYVPIGRVL